MKKALLASTALAAAGMISGSAMATDLVPAPVPAPEEGWEITVGGFAKAGFFFTSHDGPFVGADGEVERTHREVGTSVRTDSEIHIHASITLANGVTVGAWVEIETDVAAIDEHWVYIRTGFGEIQIGANDGALSQLAVGAPDPSAGFVDATGNVALVLGGTAGGEAPFNEHANGFAAPATGVADGISGDALKVTYLTPRFSGFQAGFSYTPDTDGEGSKSDGNNNIALDSGNYYNNVFEIGVNFTQTFDGVKIAIGGGAGFGDAETGISAANGGPGNRTVYHIGAQISYMGFTIGGSFGKILNAAAPAIAPDVTIYNVGATYTHNAWTIGGVWYHSENANGAALEYDHVGGGIGYALGKGVTIGAEGAWERVNAVAGQAGTVEAWIGGAYIATAF